ncbi:MAG TPA: flagellar motor protein MotB, partial [Archangium sp.]|nr:flagellar motor protein MotB [Archangium sp.]
MTNHRLLLLLCMSLLPGVAVAQASRSLPSFDLQHLHFEPSGLGSLVVGTGRTLDPGVLRVSLQAHYEHMPLNFARTWDPVISVTGLVEDKLTTHLTAAVGVLPWLHVGAQVPFVVLQRGHAFRGIVPPDGQGLGDPWVSL